MSAPNDKIKSDEIPFWSKNPNILLQNVELFPVEAMTFEQKLNAITRGIILLSIVAMIFSRDIRFVIVLMFTVLAIYLYYEREMERTKKGRTEEHFENPADLVLKMASPELSKDDVFEDPDSSNPFGNALVTDYEYNPNKKPAPPAFNEGVNEKIMKQAKTLVQELNPDQPNIADKLFKDLGEQYVFEQSLRQFTSNPSTTLVNDQTGFADFCYGSMTSCKEGNLFSCARNLPRHTN
jgi:hypothetical protein